MLTLFKISLRNNMSLKEQWSWLKFIKGFFDGKNYAKAIVLGTCLFIIILIVVSVHGFVSSKFHKTPTPTNQVGTNQGIIANSTEDKSGNSYSLFNLFNWK